MRSPNIMTTLFALAGIVAMLVIPVGVATATDLYWSGDGAWNTADANWGTVTAGPYTTATWSNTTPDSAIFEGTAGTVTLGEPISIGDMTINVASYTITGNTLNFSTGGTITNTGINVTIESGITGAPAVSANQGTNKYLTFAPTGANVALGAVSGGGSIVQFGGAATSNNSVVSVNGAKGNWNGTGTWMLTGRAYAYEHWINSGTLIIGENGSIKSNNRELRLESAATLHYNNPGAVENGAGFGMRGSIDNTSGAAITESTYNPRQNWGDWTFIGSGGADSDLYIGTGTATLKSNPTVTVQNAATTFTVGGAVADSATTTYGFTKAGAGTLALTGTTSYKGATTVAAGTLSVGDGTNSTDLAAGGVVSVASGALLDLNFASANIDDIFLLNIDGSALQAGQYGHTSSGADNGGAGVGVYDAFFSGTGILNSAGGIWNDGRFYWDGANVGGTGNSASEGGAGIWSTSVASWDRGFTAREAWTNSTDNKAIFEGTAGEVTLGSDITLGEMLINRDGYEISGHNLNFGGAATITMNSTTGGNNANLGTIASGITGAPAVVLKTGVNNPFWFAPTEGSMELGAVSGGGMIGLGGTTTGNTVASVTNSKIRLDSSGTWTVLGDAVAYEHFLVNGTLIVEGLIKCNNRALHLYDGGTLVVNGSMQSGSYPLNAVAGATVKGTGTVLTATTVQAGGTIAPGDPTGTLTIENKDCTIAGSLAITIDGDSYSTLAVGGTLDISALTATLDIFELSPGTGDMVIATYTTLIGSVFETINGLSTGWDIDYSYNEGTAIALTGGSPDGDANGDGVVDSADYIMVKTHFGGAPAAGTEGSGGDFNDNGTVDWDDLQTLMAGMNSGAAGAPIPEPATLVILLAAGLPALLKRRRRS